MDPVSRPFLHDVTEPVLPMQNRLITGVFTDIISIGISTPIRILQERFDHSSEFQNEEVLENKKFILTILKLPANENQIFTLKNFFILKF